MFQSPVTGTLVENFGFYGDVTSASFHYGLDFSAVSGSDVYAIAGGRVVFSSSSSQSDGNGYGYTIIVQHRDELGNLLDRFSVYSHLKSAPLVSAGSNVVAGQHIGDVGHSGGPYSDHLHLSVVGGLQAAGLLLANGTLSTLTNINSIVSGYARQIGTYGFDSGVPTYEPGSEPWYGNIINPGTIFGDLRGQSNDWILPIAGNDIVDGKSGIDTVEYQESINRIWFYRVDASSTIALVAGYSGIYKSDILLNIERLADNGARNIIDLSKVPLQQLAVGSSSASSKYVLPLASYSSASVDGGGGTDVLAVTGRASDWSLVAHSTSAYTLTRDSEGGRAAIGAAAATTGVSTVDLVNIEAIEFDDGTYTIAQLLAGAGPSSTSLPTISVRVKAGVDPFDEEDRGSLAGYDFEVYSDRPLTSSVTVHWEVRGYGPNSASASDFWGGVYTSGSERLDSGDTLGRFSVDVLGDDIPELDEGIRVRIWLDSADTDEARLGTVYAYGTIVNDDGQVWTGDDYGDDFSTAFLLPNDPNWGGGIIEAPTDRDFFKINAISGLTYQFGFFGGSRSEHVSGGSIRVYNSKFQIISYVDTSPDPNDIAFQITAPLSETYYFEIESPLDDDTGLYDLIYYYPSDQVAIFGSLPNGRNGIEAMLSMSQPSLKFRLFGRDQEPPAISLRTDIDINDLDLSVFGLNGSLVLGTWRSVAPGVYNFDFSGSGGEMFLIEVTARNNSGYGLFTIENSYQSWHLPPL